MQFDADDGALPSGPVDITVERPVWSPVTPSLEALPAWRIVDGVRRVEAYSMEDGLDGRPRHGLFGSYATDTYGPRSDADLLIVLRDSDIRFRDRIPEFLPADLSVPCDVFPYTAGEIEKLRRDESRWINHILEEVIWL